LFNHYIIRKQYLFCFNYLGSCSHRFLIKHSKKWRTDILKDLTDIPKLGSPGQLIVYGTNAVVVSIGDQNQDILIAAGTVGKGRVIIISHDAYI